MDINKKNYIDDKIVNDALDLFIQDSNKNIFDFETGKYRITDVESENDIPIFTIEKDGKTYYFCFV